jgi:fatty acid desaturase
VDCLVLVKAAIRLKFGRSSVALVQPSGLRTNSPSSRSLSMAQVEHTLPGQTRGGESCFIHEVGEPLPSAVVRGARTRLSPQARQEIGRLMRPDPARFLLELVFTWGAIVGTVVLAQWVHSYWLIVPAVCFIATRQNILALLMHEQCHRIGFRSRLGDYLCNLTSAYPLLMSVEGYRKIHLAHHRSYFTDKDPDFRRKQGEEWTFPQPGSRLLGTLLVALSGLGALAFFKGKQARQAPGASRSPSAPAWVRLTYYAALAGLLTWLHAWPIFLLYWVLPMMTVLQVIARWGAICEHRYNLIRPSIEESTPIIEPSWWESQLLPNLNFTLHIYHHWYPAIPHSKLPQVHRIFRREGLINEENIFRGFRAYVRFLLRPPAAAQVSSPGSRAGQAVS